MSDLTVEIRQMREDDPPYGPPVPTVVCRLDLGEDGAVVMHGAQLDIARSLSAFRCRDAETGRIYSITDGEPWLRLLPFNLTGSILWAAELTHPERRQSLATDENPGGSP
jgi:hypothetical protein